MFNRQLRHTTSWETSVSASSTPQRTLSCDSSDANKISNISEDLPLQTPGVSSSSSEHDNQEASAWSSDYSNSEDEYTNLEDGVQAVRSDRLIDSNAYSPLEVIL